MAFIESDERETPAAVVCSPRSLALVLVLLGTACVGPSPSYPSDPAARLAAATPEIGPLTRRAKLDYEVRGQPFPLPTTIGTVAGHRTTMLVDTGSSTHIITGWLARKLALPMRKVGELGTDHTGKAIAMYRIEQPQLTIEGWGPLAKGAVFATEVPDVVEKLGIGAFISPQRLDEEGDAIVVDLRKGELRSAWWEEARWELARSGTAAGSSALVGLEEQRACETGGHIHIQGLAFVIPVAIEGHHAELLVDTGAHRTDLFMLSAAGIQLVGQAAGTKKGGAAKAAAATYSSSGKIGARKVTAAHLIAREVTTTADINIVVEGRADSSCPRDGALAMDVLRSCTLLLGHNTGKMDGRCVSGHSTTSSPSPR